MGIHRRKMGYPQKKNPWLYSIVVEICQIVLNMAKNNPKIQKFKLLKGQKI